MLLVGKTSGGASKYLNAYDPEFTGFHANAKSVFSQKSKPVEAWAIMQKWVGKKNDWSEV